MNVCFSFQFLRETPNPRGQRGGWLKQCLWWGLLPPTTCPGGCLAVVPVCPFSLQGRDREQLISIPCSTSESSPNVPGARFRCWEQEGLKKFEITWVVRYLWVTKVWCGIGRKSKHFWNNGWRSSRGVSKTLLMTPIRCNTAVNDTTLGTGNLPGVSLFAEMRFLFLPIMTEESEPWAMTRSETVTLKVCTGRK